MEEKDKTIAIATATQGIMRALVTLNDCMDKLRSTENPSPVMNISTYTRMGEMATRLDVYEDIVYTFGYFVKFEKSPEGYYTFAWIHKYDTQSASIVEEWQIVLERVDWLHGKWTGHGKVMGVEVNA